MSDIFDHELDAFHSLMDTLEDSPADLIEPQNFFTKKSNEPYDEIESISEFTSVFERW